LLQSGSDPLDPYQLEVESVDVARDSLYVLKDRIPTSLYERVKLADTKTLFEKPVYMSTFSKDRLSQLLNELASTYRNSWIWSWGMGPIDAPRTSTYQPVFLEARVYGIDTIIGTYDARKFDGVVLEIIYKPFPNQTMWDQGTRVMRARSNVYILSNYEEYVSYVDGVKLGREKTNYVSMISKYSKFLTTKHSVGLRKALLGEKKPIKKEPKSPKPKKEKKADTYSYAQVATEMFTNNLGTWPLGENE